MCKRVERICQVDPDGWYAPVIGQELVRCENCKYFVLDYGDVWKGKPIITGHEVCTKWAYGCQTVKDGYCYLAERKEE